MGQFSNTLGELARTPTDPMFYVRLLWRRKWIMLGLTALVLAAVTFYTLRQTKIYASRVSLIIDASAPRVLEKVGDVMDEPVNSFWYSKEYYQTQYKIITSRAVAQRVVDKLGLQSDVKFLGLEKSPDSKRAELMGRIDAVAALQGKIKVDPVKDSRIVNIVVNDVDPNRAALFANEVAESYIQENLALKLRMTETASQWLEERLASLEEKSKVSELQIFNFKKTADMLTTSLEDRQSMVSQRLNALNAALTDVRLTVADVQARVAAIDSLKKDAQEGAGDARWGEGLPAAIGNSLIQQLKVRLATQRAECADLGDRYLAAHPRLTACLEKEGEARADLVRELNNIAIGAETELKEAQGKEKNLLALFESAKAEAFEVNKKQIEFDQLKRESDNNQRLYDLVLKRLKDIELSGLLRTSNARVLDAARPMMRPVSPNVHRNIMLGLVVGFLASMGVILLLELLDNTVTSQKDIEELLEVPFLGIVPNIPEPTSGNTRDLHVHLNPKSSVAECCRAIRTNLLFMTPDKPFKRLLVTSTGPKEGKTTSAISLGIAMAQSGNRVLLVDTDMRRPRLHKALGISNEIGTSSLIIDQRPLEDAIKSTEVPGLFLLPCGPIPPNPAELLHTDAFRQLMDQLSEKFDRVIFDSPPVGAVADAVVLATKVDGVLLVFRAAKTAREAARRTVRAMKDVNAKLFGAILNNINLADAKYGDYYYAYRQYGYYYGEKSPKAQT